MQAVLGAHGNHRATGRPGPRAQGCFCVLLLIVGVQSAEIVYQEECYSS